MYVVMNSDVLYATYLLRDKLPKSILELCQACIEHDVGIVIPETTKLEFDRIQKQHAQSKRKELQNAFESLRKYSITFKNKDPEKIVNVPDLLKMMQNTGVKVQMAVPTGAELREAHRRACLHEAPITTDSKSNEMRDVVIWLIAIRIAQERGGALLVSKDKVHNAESAQHEATRVGLRTAGDLESGMDLLEFDSPSAKLIRDLLKNAWQDLCNAGLSVQLPVEVLSVRDSRFIQGKGHLRQASCVFKASTGDGKRLEASMHANADEQIPSITLRNVRLEDQPIGEVAIQWNILGPQDSDDRYDALRKTIGGGE